MHARDFTTIVPGTIAVACLALCSPAHAAPAGSAVDSPVDSPEGPDRPDRPVRPDLATVEFRWDAPAQGCPTEAEVLAELERLLGGGLDEQGDRRLTAIARVRQEPDGSWDLRLWTVTPDATRQRSMIGADCAVLADAAALLAAMAIDPAVLERVATTEAVVAQAEDAEEVDARDAPDPERPDADLPDTDEPEPEPNPEPKPDGTSLPRRFTVAVGAAGGLSVGDLPGVGPVLRVGLGLIWAHARFEVEGHYAFVRRARFDDAPDRGADLRMAFAAVRGCGVLRHRPAKLEFPLCAGIEGGAQFGEGVGFVTVDEGAIAWVALDLSPGLSWAPIPNLAVGLRLEPYVTLARPRFEADGIGEIWRPLPVGFRAVAGLEARF